MHVLEDDSVRSEKRGLVWSENVKRTNFDFPWNQNSACLNFYNIMVLVPWMPFLSEKV